MRPAEAAIEEAVAEPGRHGAVFGLLFGSRARGGHRPDSGVGLAAFLEAREG